MLLTIFVVLAMVCVVILTCKGVERGVERLTRKKPKLSDKLEHVLRTHDLTKYEGVCYVLIECDCPIMSCELILRSKWPFHSGDLLYPVPATTECTPLQQYHRSTRKERWDQNTEYGRLRLDLFEHIIKYLRDNGK